MYEGNKLN